MLPQIEDFDSYRQEIPIGESSVLPLWSVPACVLRVVPHLVFLIFHSVKVRFDFILPLQFYLTRFVDCCCIRVWL